VHGHHVLHGMASNCLQTQELLYGQATSGMFGYSHLTGAYQGGQAEYVRVPLGESCMPHTAALHCIIMCACRRWSCCTARPCQACMATVTLQEGTRAARQNTCVCPSVGPDHHSAFQPCWNITPTGAH
jgi:hypothetical protein